MSDQTDHETCCGADPPKSSNDPFDTNTVSGRCETISGTPIPASHLKPFLAAAVMRRHVVDAQNRVVDVAKDQRLFPQWMANALRIETRGLCATPGCMAAVQAAHRPHPTLLPRRQNRAHQRPPLLLSRQPMARQQPRPREQPRPRDAGDQQGLRRSAMVLVAFVIDVYSRRTEVSRTPLGVGVSNEGNRAVQEPFMSLSKSCLLYTSDAADE